jgi:ATP-binding cassette subfamily B protein
VQGSEITAGTVVAFTTLQTRLLFPTVQLLQVSLDVQTSFALFRRIFEYLDLRPAIVDRSDAVALAPTQVAGDVRLEGVWFAYPRPEAPAQADDTSTADGDEELRWALQGRRPARATGSADGRGRPERLWQDHAVLPGAEAVRRHARQGPARRARRPRPQPGVRVRDDRMVTQDTYLFHASVLDNLRYARESPAEPTSSPPPEPPTSTTAS